MAEKMILRLRALRVRDEACTVITALKMEYKFKGEGKWQRNL